MRVKYTEEGLLLIPETEKEGSGLSSFVKCYAKLENS